MATASDDFNRADGALGSNWTTVIGSGGEIATFTAQKIARGNSAGDSGSMWAVATTNFADDHESQITKAEDTVENFGGPAVRMSASSGGQGYVYYNNGSLQKIVDGTRTSISSTLATFTIDDVVRLRATGTTLEAWKNGASQGTFTDAALTTGQPGILFVQDNAGAVKNWQATDEFGAGGGGPANTGGGLMLRGVGG